VWVACNDTGSGLSTQIRANGGENLQDRSLLLYLHGDMVKRFLRSQRTGFYFGVVEEGRVQAGDEIEPLGKHPDGFPVADVTRLYTTEKANKALLSKAISVSALPESWRGHFEHQLERLQR
jgi:MOSC domain-containing protein YiiM